MFWQYFGSGFFLRSIPVFILPPGSPLSLEIVPDSTRLILRNELVMLVWFRWYVSIHSFAWSGKLFWGLSDRTKYCIVPSHRIRQMFLVWLFAIARECWMAHLPHRGPMGTPRSWYFRDFSSHSSTRRSVAVYVVEFSDNMKGKHLDPECVKEVFALRLQGKSLREIAVAVGRGKTSVKWLLDRYDPTSGLPLVPRKCRPSQIAPDLANVDVLKTAVSLYSLESGRVIIKALKETGVRASRSAIYRALQRAGIRKVCTSIVKAERPSGRKRKIFEWCTDQASVFSPSLRPGRRSRPVSF